jgi:hypothetical protein
MGLVGTFRGTEHTRREAMRRDCCYYQCSEPGTIHIGVNGNPDTDWICFLHLHRWDAQRARFLADGLGCEMQELGRKQFRNLPVHSVPPMRSESRPLRLRVQAYQRL